MKSNLAKILVLVASSTIICVAKAEDHISRNLTPPKEDESSDSWNEHPISSTENSQKVTKDSYLPIYETESDVPKSKSTTAKPSFPKKAGGSDAGSKLKTIPESEEVLESFESAAQSYYPGYGYGGGRWNGNRYRYGRPARPYYGNYYGRPWGSRNTIWVG